MQRGVSYLIYRLSQVSGRVYLIIAVLIFAAANSVTRKLTDLGALHLIEGRNPFSFCNILFVGNICAFFTLWVVYRQQLSKSNFRQLSYKNWFGLMGVSIFAGVLAPSLIFLALERTAVNNVILIGRIETFIILALSVFVLKDRVNFWGVAGSIVSFIGVILTIFLQSPSGNEVNMGGFQIGAGELMTAAAALASAVANIISRVTLAQVSLGFFNLVKTILSTIIFLLLCLNYLAPTIL